MCEREFYERKNRAEKNIPRENILFKIQFFLYGIYFLSAIKLDLIIVKD